MLSIYLLRHGETEFSRQDRFCGNIDAPLNESGRRMAACFADAYGDLPWRAIITSTRGRTVSMAEPLATRTGIPVRRDARLDEMFYGEWQGLSKEEAAARDPEHYLAWRRDPTLGPPEGESPFEVYARASAMLEDARARYSEGAALLVSHKTVLRILLCRLLRVPVAEYRARFACPVAGLSVVDIGREGPTVRLIGDVSHLPPELRGVAAPSAVPSETAPPPAPASASDAAPIEAAA